MSKLESTYNSTPDFLTHTRGTCKELSSDVVSTCQSDLPLMDRSMSRVRRMRNTISEITRSGEEETLCLDKAYARTRGAKGVFLI
jgi:hypothetical protein